MMFIQDKQKRQASYYVLWDTGDNSSVTQFKEYFDIETEPTKTSYMMKGISKSLAAKGLGIAICTKLRIMKYEGNDMIIGSPEYYTSACNIPNQYSTSDLVL